MNYVGIDNGVTGSIAVVSDVCTLYAPVPVKKEQNYTKGKANITRIDFPAFVSLLKEYVIPVRIDNGEPLRAFIERPMVNPGRFKATVSALRSLEAVLIAIELMGISYQYIDSKVWQKQMLPTGLKGIELKHASKDVGIRLFPQHEDEINKQKDADGLLIAEWARRAGL